MPAILQQYVLEANSTGDYDDYTVAEILKVLNTVLESVYDLETFPFAVKKKLVEIFGERVDTGVASIGKNLFIKIRGVTGANMVQVDGYRYKEKEGVKVEDLGMFEKLSLRNYNENLLVMAKFQSVRSLQDIAAYQVACSLRNSQEQIHIPYLVRKGVNKFMITRNIGQ